MKLRMFCIFVTATVLAGCRNNNKAASIEKLEDTTPVQDARILKESFRQEDTISPGKQTDSLAVIRANFKRINSISNWTVIDTTDLWESTEGGEARFYYSNGRLEKIIAQLLGETYQQLIEYYLLDGKLSFVFEKTLRYNRPIYYDSAATKASEDTEAFDIKKSTVMESRNYFKNEKLIYQVHTPAVDPAEGEDHLLTEEERIKTAFKKLIGPGKAGSH